MTQKVFWVLLLFKTIKQKSAFEAKPFRGKVSERNAIGRKVDFRSIVSSSEIT